MLIIDNDIKHKHELARFFLMERNGDHLFRITLAEFNFFWVKVLAILGANVSILLVFIKLTIPYGYINYLKIKLKS